MLGHGVITKLFWTQVQPGFNSLCSFEFFLPQDALKMPNFILSSLPHHKVSLTILAKVVNLSVHFSPWKIFSSRMVKRTAELTWHKYMGNNSFLVSVKQIKNLSHNIR